MLKIKHLKTAKLYFHGNFATATDQFAVSPDNFLKTEVRFLLKTALKSENDKKNPLKSGLVTATWNLSAKWPEKKWYRFFKIF